MTQDKFTASAYYDKDTNTDTISFGDKNFASTIVIDKDTKSVSIVCTFFDEEQAITKTTITKL